MRVYGIGEYKPLDLLQLRLTVGMQPLGSKYLKMIVQLLLSLANHQVIGYVAPGVRCFRTLSLCLEFLFRPLGDQGFMQVPGLHVEADRGFYLASTWDFG